MQCPYAADQASNHAGKTQHHTKDVQSALSFVIEHLLLGTHRAKNPVIYMSVHQAVNPPTSSVVLSKLAVELETKAGQRELYGESKHQKNQCILKPHGKLLHWDPGIARAAVVAHALCFVRAGSQIDNQQRGVDAGKEGPPELDPTQPVADVQGHSDAPRDEAREGEYRKRNPPQRRSPPPPLGRKTTTPRTGQLKLAATSYSKSSSKSMLMSSSVSLGASGNPSIGHMLLVHFDLHSAHSLLERFIFLSKWIATAMTNTPRGIGRTYAARIRPHVRLS
eukprot:67096-Hanusia_phi.AAC.2